MLLVFTDPRCGPCQALLSQLAASQDVHSRAEATGAWQNCTTGYHCCVCRDDNDGQPLPNVLINGGYSCTTYCSTLGFTVISDTPC